MPVPLPCVHSCLKSSSAIPRFLHQPICFWQTSPLQEAFPISRSPWMQCRHPDQHDQGTTAAGGGPVREHTCSWTLMSSWCLHMPVHVGPRLICFGLQKARQSAC